MFFKRFCVLLEVSLCYYLSIYIASVFKFFLVTLPPVAVRSIVISLSVCLSTCLSALVRISETTRPYFTKFLHVLHVAVARSSSDGSAICTSGFVDDVVFT